MKKALLVILMAFSAMAQAGTGQIGSVNAGSFPNTKWEGVDKEEGMTIKIDIDAKNNWVAQLIQNGKTTTFKGSTLIVAPLFDGPETAQNPLVVFFTVNGAPVLPPLAIIVKAGKMKLSYDTLTLTSK
jgi:hypothetical protein